MAHSVHPIPLYFITLIIDLFDALTLSSKYPSQNPQYIKTLFWVVTPCSLVNGYHCVDKTFCFALILGPVTGNRKFRRNAGTHLQHYTASRPVRPSYWYSQSPESTIQPQCTKLFETFSLCLSFIWKPLQRHGYILQGNSYGTAGAILSVICERMVGSRWNLLQKYCLFMQVLFMSNSCGLNSWLWVALFFAAWVIVPLPYRNTSQKVWSPW